jgi:CRP-like cAMP-binding protein
MLRRIFIPILRKSNKTWSPKKRNFGVGKVTGGGEAMEKLQYPTSFLQMIRELKHAEPGVLVLNTGMLISLIGMSSSDMMFLRSCSVIGGLCGMYYNFTRKPPLKPAIAWGAVFILLHIGKVTQLLLDKTPISFDGDELDLYDRHLSNLSARKYYDLLDFCEKIKLNKGEVLIEENRPYKYINFLIKGEAGVYKSNKKIATIKGDSPRAVFGEISFLKEINSVGDKLTNNNNNNNDKKIEDGKLEVKMNPLATARVIAEKECTFISINTDELSILFQRDPELKIVFMSSLTNALVAKLIAQQSKVSDLSGYSSFANMVSSYFDQGNKSNTTTQKK